MLTVKEAAERLKVTPERVRNMIYSGVMPAEKFGSNWSIPGYAVEQRLASMPQRGRPKKFPPKENISYHVVALNRSMYEECREYQSKYGEIQNIMLLENDEEREFFIMQWNFFLQQKQKILVEQGVF